MTTPSPETIAKFLQDNPSFFEDNAAVFADLKVPHPDSGAAIPLVQRQLLNLREQNQLLKGQLTGLIENASGNHRISQLLIQWCSLMLSENNAKNIPNEITQGISNIFQLSDICLRLWGLNKLTTNSENEKDLGVLKQFVNNQKTPICGPVSMHAEIAALLPEKTQSMAIIPLSINQGKYSIGILVLGSEDATRFTMDMGVDFLETIAALCSAALSRLSSTQQYSA